MSSTLYTCSQLLKFCNIEIGATGCSVAKTNRWQNLWIYQSQTVIESLSNLLHLPIHLLG